MTAKKWGHDELAHDLAEKFRADTSVMVWENMQMGPSGTQRPDVYVLPKSYSRFTPTTYEIKVSMSDFRSDVTAGKWQGYLKYSSAVVFAAPAGLISKDDVPAGCGLILRHDEVWRTVKKPTLQRIETLPHETWMKMMIDGLERQKREAIRQRPTGSEWAVEQKLRVTFGEDVACLVRRALFSRSGLANEVAEAEKKRLEIRQGTEAYARSHRESVEREIGRLTAEQQGLAVALGLEEGASLRQLASAISAACHRLRGDSEVDRLTRLFQRIQEVTADGLKPLPGETPQQRALPGQIDMGTVWGASI